jgi:hypothetical protein
MTVLNLCRFACLLGFLALSSTATGDSVVVVGNGSPGSWTTVLDIANPLPTPLTVQIASLSEFQTVCPGPCPWLDVTVPGDGTLQMPAPAGTSLQTLYLSTPDGAPLPTVRARTINSLSPQQAVELLAVRQSTLLRLGDSVLNFPGAIRSADVHTNLAVDLISPGGGYGQFTVLVEALSSAGQVLGSGTFTNCSQTGQGCLDLFLVDVLGQLGVTDLQDGHLRVTKTPAFDGQLWGFTSIVYPAGNVSVSVGLNP